MRALYTTFRLLRDADACVPRYRHLARALGGVRAYGENKPILISTILETNGFDDALWALCEVTKERVARRDRLARLFACWCIRHTPLPDGLTRWELLKDQRLRDLVETTERFANGRATNSELANAIAAAHEAYWEISHGAFCEWDAASAAQDAAHANPFFASEANSDAQVAEFKRLLEEEVEHDEYD